MDKFFSILLIMVLIFFLGGVEELQAEEPVLVEVAKKIEGYITKIDPENNVVFINGTEYNLNKESLIRLNNRLNGLNGLKPPAPGFYKWAEIYLDSCEKILKIEAFYKVVEGTIAEISYLDNSLVLAEYQQDTDSEKINRRYFLLEQNRNFRNFKKNDHVILVTARDKVLSIQ